MTVKFNGFAVLELRLETVRVLDPPTPTEDGPKLHVAPELQDNATGDRNVLGPAAEMVKVAVLEPMVVTFDRALEESVNTGVPVPDS